jgi:hypothetical protein
MAGISTTFGFSSMLSATNKRTSTIPERVMASYLSSLILSDCCKITLKFRDKDKRTMKILMVLFTAFLGMTANAKSSNVVFDCKAEIRIDINETQEIGMTVESTVESRGTDYVAHLIGATQPGPFATSKQVLVFHDGIRVGGIRAILSKVSLSSAERLQITSVVIYTQGNFDDDLAGVRGVEFVDAQNGVLARGMFFGWGGPVACR